MKNVSNGLPLRYKLTIWYILLFSISIIGYEIYGYFELKNNLFSQVDSALAAESERAVQDLDVEKGILVFQNKENMPANTPAARVTAFKMRIVEARGKILDARNDFPAIVARLAPGYETLSLGNARYRVLTTEIPMAGLQEKSFMQVADSLAMVDEELASALTRLLVGLPIILIIAAAGGLLLANAALRPIVDMTGLSEAISEDKLSERLKYRGPDDEIGKLAATFDSMLDRLEASFLREKRFTADASHELKTPLTAIKGKLEVALSQSRSAKEYEAALSGL
ncbi:HAMP domain-containing protein, partial [bacterium]|nr:HAMP domain-containing protein [bacterium]